MFKQQKPTVGRSDYAMLKRAQQNDKQEAIEKYAASLQFASSNAQWFEKSSKAAFSIQQARQESFIKEELSNAAAELQKRRRARLKALYEAEHKSYEDKLNSKGLSIHRERP
uniref:Uncharacterized protein n=1 Tax=Chromera velia CCMP2878 TaxID=1169474 RepID=A0A0G4HZ00_9ALVE|mmetsp:Transcript_33203/g.65906  ORF Transcript_33203/g.65906 Transcript_33203/m.65906 type:complete len:112 (-) Transcript_33203:230-565(-)|eukprot:Cvel_9616.t1-p1 / transcript=Cvel_9616.t1 / gene=Cvel_9616 / organism=Chromera_velia_CCMP2878 / gene_product=hypothetical protein / transcript_product=hypothetical protein / location=Cvel_scaffold559:755-1820(-) / protein_length=111 / sequence_SO=supercontig / SO=protein_coding / is_pseudo=false